LPPSPSLQFGTADLARAYCSYEIEHHVDFFDAIWDAPRQSDRWLPGLGLNNFLFQVYRRNGLHPARYPPAEDHTSSDLRAELRKLKQAYETLSIKKDKELSALFSEKDSVHNQLSIMQQDYTKLLKNKKVEAEQATEAAEKLERNIDELKVLAQKKDQEISILRAEAVGAENNLQKMHSLVKEKDDEIQRFKGRHPESVQKHKDISETNKKSWSGDPAVTVRDRPENCDTRQTVEENYISETRTMEIDEQDESTHKRRRAFSMSNVSILCFYFLVI
jgi:chromosome segregation ATPase